MDYLPLFGYIIEVTISVLTVLAVLHFYHRYSLKFYRTFAYCIITGNIYSILSYLGHYLTEVIFREDTVGVAVKAKLSLIFNFMGMPFMLLCLFFIVVLFRDLFGKPVTPALKRGSLVFGLFMAVLAVSIYIDLFSGDFSSLGRAISNVLEILILLILAAGVGQGFYYLREIKDRQHRRVLLVFTLLFLGMFVILAVHIKFIPGLFSDIIVLLPWELILLIYMVKKMNEFYLLQPGLLARSRSLEKVYRKYRITEREQEIIALICRGKTNRDIEDALFISLQTVKNNIYNIFKKLNVKNRVELVNFIRTQASSEESVLESL